FGLLVFNQFLPPSTSTASAARLDAGAGAVASASEMLSNQVSNWLSQLSNDVNIGFNYRAKDSYSNEEVRLMFSKTLFNSRLLVETNVGVTGNTVANASVSNSSNANSLVGEFFTEYKVSDDGRFRLKAYNRSNSDDLINFNAPYTQGFGLSFRQDFDNWYDLRQRMKRKEKKIMYLEPLPDDQQ
ncbi:MAG: translocation/assembly module TamB domain-containing protein, partial [Bacteroidota bacterium]